MSLGTRLDYMYQHFSNFSEYKIECSKVHPQTDEGQHEIICDLSTMCAVNSMEQETAW